MLRKEHVEEFQKLYKGHFDIDLPFQEAYEECAKLVRFMEIITKKIRGVSDDEPIVDR